MARYFASDPCNKTVAAFRLEFLIVNVAYNDIYCLQPGIGEKTWWTQIQNMSSHIEVAPKM